MIELPECYTLADQLRQTLVGKRILHVTANASPHKFAWFTGEPGEYSAKLTGKTITGANPGTRYTCGGNTEVECEDMLLVLTTPVRYYPAGAKLPPKHQLLLEFEDGSAMVCTVQMWGAMLCFPAEGGSVPENYKVNRVPSPLEKGFDLVYFRDLFAHTEKKLSLKAFLATQQRIPGLGNGVLQDILWNAKLHPKTRLSTLSGEEVEHLFHAVKDTLSAMAAGGGRDTEKDLYGNPGSYKTVLSSKTLTKPCPACGGELRREAYLGGNIYFCPKCQVYENNQ